MPRQCTGPGLRLRCGEGVGFEDLVLPRLAAEVHAFERGDLVLAAGPQEDDEDVAGVLPAGGIEVIEDALHGGAAEGVEQVEDEIALGEGEVLRVLLERGDAGAAAFAGVEALEVGLGLPVEDRRELDTEDLLEGEFGGDK